MKLGPKPAKLPKVALEARRQVAERRKAHSARESEQSHVVTVTDMMGAFAWMPFSIARLHTALLLACCPISEPDMALQWASLTLSTAFSGVGCPEIAGSMVCCYFLAHLGISVLGSNYPRHLRTLWAVECEPDAQDELRHSAYGPEHLFENTLNFISSDVRRRIIQKSTQWSNAQLAAVGRAGDTCLSGAKCLCHNALTLCLALASDMHVAGSPCIDYSRQWHAAKQTDGDSFPSTYAWMLHRLHCLEALIVHENVAGFPVELMVDVLGHVYLIFTHIYDSIRLGWVSTRSRRFTILVRRDLFVSIALPFEEYISMCRRHTAMTYHCFLTASAAEIQGELEWASARPTSMTSVPDHLLSAVLFDECEQWGAPLEEVVKVAKENQHTRALIPSECRRLYQYRQLALRTGGATALFFLAAYLGQEVNTHPQWSCKGSINTIVSHSPILFVQAFGRWACPTELLATQGIASSDAHINFGETTTFCTPRPGRDRAQIIVQAGNGMNTHAVGLAMLWAFFSIKRKQTVVLSDSLERLLSALGD